MRSIAFFIVAAASAFFFCSAASSQQVWHKHPDGVYRKTPPNATSPSSELLQEGPLAPLPPLPSGVTVLPCSPAPLTALDKLPGTGSPSPTIDGKKPVPPILDAETIGKLRDLLNGKLQPPSASITHTLDGETSQRLSRCALILEVLAVLGSVMLGGSMAGKAGPLVARLLRGLLSLSEEKSSASNPTAGASSSTPPNPSSGDSQAGHSSTPKPNS